MPINLNSASQQTFGLLLSPQAAVARSKAHILRERAKIIARKSVATQYVDHTISLLEFQLEYEIYGLNVERIQEVCILKEYTCIPGVPKHILGITNLRGRIIAIVDLKQLFGLPRKGLAYHNKVIVVGNTTMVMGLLADEIIGLRTIPLSDIQAELRALTGKRAEYFAGVTLDWTSFLEVEKILADKSLVVNVSIPPTN